MDDESQDTSAASNDTPEWVRDIEQKLGVAPFSDWGILAHALSHYSFSDEVAKDGKDNEHFEELGDAILQTWFVFRFIVANNRGWNKAERAGLKSIVCSNHFLGRVSIRLGLLNHLICGPVFKENMLLGDDDARNSIAADLFEALIGAVYLDQGEGAAFACLSSILEADVLNISRIYAFRHAHKILKNQAGDLYIHWKKLKRRVARAGRPDMELSVSITMRSEGEELSTGDCATPSAAFAEVVQLARRSVKSRS